MCINARRPIAAQLAKFPALGLGAQPPTALELMQRMVSDAEADYAFDRSEDPRRRVPFTRAQYFKQDDNYPAVDRSACAGVVLTPRRANRDPRSTPWRPPPLCLRNLFASWTLRAGY